MSRGLGNRQRLLLAAAVQVEGGYRQGAWLPLAMVLRAVWTPEIAIEAEAAAVARVDREAAKTETWRHEAAEERAVAVAGVAAGDPSAVVQFDRIKTLAMLRNAIQARRRPKYGGAPLLRHPGTERLLNPSRLTGPLAQRGLIEREAHRGHGSASIRLTAAGRLEAGTLAQRKRK